MNGYQEAYEKMSNVTVIFLNGNLRITSNFPEFDKYFSAIKKTNDKIQKEELWQAIDTKGETVAKKRLRQQLILEVLELSRRAVAYGNNLNDNVFIEKVNYNESDLKRTSDNKLVNIAQIVHDNVSASATGLVEYGVTEAMISGLQITTNAFNNLIPRIRMEIVNKKEATQLLSGLFKTLVINWEKIDILVEMVKNTEPEFYSEYNNLRRVIPAGTRHLSLKVSVVDAESLEPEPNVKITLSITIDGVKKSIVKRTFKKGGSNYSGLIDGVYNITAEKTGFETYTSTVGIATGEMTDLKISLKKV